MRLFALVSVLTLSVSSAVASAQTIPADARVAYISSQRISAESSAGKAGLTRMQALQQERAGQIRPKQQALEATRQQLAKAVAAEERTRLGLQETAQRTEIERLAAQMQLDLQNLQRDISIELRPKVLAALTEVVKGTKIEIVLNQESAIVWSLPGLDLTAAVLEKMNAPARP